MLRPQNKVNPNFSMSSMADIIFLLLIFFMVTSTFLKTNVLNLSLPKSKADVKQQMSFIRILIDKSHNIYYEDKKMSLQEVENRIIVKKRIQQDVSIALHVDRTVDVQQVVNIMDLAKKHNMKLILATTVE